MNNNRKSNIIELIKNNEVSNKQLDVIEKCTKQMIFNNIYDNLFNVSLGKLSEMLLNANRYIDNSLCTITNERFQMILNKLSKKNDNDTYMKCWYIVYQYKIEINDIFMWVINNDNSKYFKLAINSGFDMYKCLTQLYNTKNYIPNILNIFLLNVNFDNKWNIELFNEKNIEYIKEVVYNNLFNYNDMKLFKKYFEINRQQKIFSDIKIITKLSNKDSEDKLEYLDSLDNNIFDIWQKYIININDELIDYNLLAYYSIINQTNLKFIISNLGCNYIIACLNVIYITLIDHIFFRSSYKFIEYVIKTGEKFNMNLNDSSSLHYLFIYNKKHSSLLDYCKCIKLVITYMKKNMTSVEQKYYFLYKDNDGLIPCNHIKEISTSSENSKDLKELSELKKYILDYLTELELY